MIVITRNNEYVEKDWTEDEFNATSLPLKGWSIYTGEWPLPVPDPPIIIPTSVSMRQARLQLSILGLCQAVNQAVQGMSEAAQIEWEYGATADRENTLTQQMIAMLGWTEEQADAYFLAASQL